MSATWELVLPFPSPPLSLNHRRHWRATASLTRVLRETTFVLARQACIGSHDYVHVTLHYRPRDKRVRDAENPIPTAKACCDGLVDAGVVPDDDPSHMGKGMPVIHAPDRGLRPRLWLVVEAKEVSS